MAYQTLHAKLPRLGRAGEALATIGAVLPLRRDVKQGHALAQLTTGLNMIQGRS